MRRGGRSLLLLLSFLLLLWLLLVLLLLVTIIIVSLAVVKRTEATSWPQVALDREDTHQNKASLPWPPAASAAVVWFRV